MWHAKIQTLLKKKYINELNKVEYFREIDNISRDLAIKIKSII